MQTIDWCLTLLCLVVCGISAVTDVRTEKIRNQVVLPTAVLSFGLHLWLSILRGSYILYLLNVGLIALFSIALYALHFMGAGDSKLLICIMAALPEQLYAGAMPGYFGSARLLIYIFSVCLICILIESLYLLIRYRTPHPPLGKVFAGSLLKNYLRGLAVMTFVNELLFLTVPEFYTEHQYLVSLLDLILIGFTSEYALFTSNALVYFMLGCEAVIAFLTPYGERITHGELRLYLVFLLMILIRRFCIDRYNYKTVPTAQVKSGMILSLPTTMQMQRSRVKGLPGLSTEDLRSRLTAEEAESVRRWEHSRYGSAEITVVRVLPLGLFIAVGTFLFLIERTLIYLWS